MKTHELKTEPQYFQAVLDGRKRFEIRKNDRGFEEGDKLLLKEYDADVHVFTGRRVEVTVTYITDYEQQPGYVVLGIELTMTTMTDQELEELQEIQTTGWLIKVGDVYSNGNEALHLKVTKIELEKGCEPDDAKIYFQMVDPIDNNISLSDCIDYDDWHRAWYINENWYK